MCTVIVSVVGNLSLALITATLSFRIYKSVLAAVNKTNEGHPFKVSQASDTLGSTTNGAMKIIFCQIDFPKIIPVFLSQI